jgi:predicted DNA-binding transcriptional regulator AlpA
VELLSTAQVLERTQIPRSTFYFMRARGDFPQPMRLAPTRAVAWRADDVNAWLRLNPPPARRSHKDP